MTSFETYNALGALSPYVARGKGSIKDRANESREHLKNDMKGLGKATVVGAGTTVAAMHANKKLFGASTNWNTSINKVFKKQANSIGEYLKELIKDGIVDKKTGRISKEYANTLKNGGKFIGRMKVFAANAALKFVELGQTVMKKVAGTSTRQKVVAGIVSVGLITIGKIFQKQCYKAGQIDQKYTDKAAAEKADKK